MKKIMIIPTIIQVDIKIFQSNISTRYSSIRLYQSCSQTCMVILQICTSDNNIAFIKKLIAFV